MRTLRILFLFVFVVLTAAAPASFTPYLVEDIETTPSPASSEPTDFVSLGRLALFQVQDSDHFGLWRSDGTASGTYRLVETGVQILEVVGNRCFFISGAGDEGWLLWITDGTLPGTFSLGETGSDQEQKGFAAWVPSHGVFYFANEIPGQDHGEELWRTDGTPGGTSEVLDIEPGPDSSSPSDLTNFRQRLYFSATSGLWQSDGTAAGTVKVRDVPVTSLQVVGSRLVFIGTDSQGSELWASDGTTAGTRRIADLVEGAGSPEFDHFQIAGNRLFFTATAGATGRELYVTDGTAQGTRRLTWFSDPEAIESYSWSPAPMPIGNRLLFWARDTAYGTELWSSDGTPKGTRRVLDACPGECSSYESPLLPFRGRIYYGRQDESVGSQLWVTDGTASGTRLVKDIPWAGDAWPWLLGASRDRLFFVAYGGNWAGTWIWTTDGTAAGTVLLAEFFDYELVIDGAVAGDTLVFSGEDEDVELWSSDGTPAGTHLLVDIADQDLGGSNPRGLMTLGESVLFFTGDHYSHALWRSDGTAEGTSVVTTQLGGRYDAWTASATRVFFEATRLRESLWTSDGTKAGTVRLTPPGVRCKGEMSAPVIKLGNRVFFSAWNPPYGAEPWVTDGTPQGTRLLADLHPGRGHSYPRDFTVFAGRVWFAADLHLWKSDGTAKGTVALGPELQDVHPRITYGGGLWFTGRNSGGSTELWGTDGTAAKTRRIAELKTIESLTVHGGRLWFLGHGRELWSTDGTAAGTRKLDLPASSFRLLLSDGLRLYLSDSQSALWVSDGTAAGTRKISSEGIDARYEPVIWIAFAGRLFYPSHTGLLYTSDGTVEGTRPVRPDGEPRYADRLMRFGNRLVVVTNWELWESDGTAAGTKLILDHVYSEVVKAGPRLFFAAWEEKTGTELWAMRE